MREGAVYVSGIFAGIISELEGDGYVFTYDDSYLASRSCPAVSLSLPKEQKTFRSPHLFPFFANMISEGANRSVQSRLHHVSEDDDFGILLATAYIDTPGAVTVKRIGDE